jgi:predicted outer membrane repeat protein
VYASHPSPHPAQSALFCRFEQRPKQQRPFVHGVASATTETRMHVPVASLHVSVEQPSVGQATGSPMQLPPLQLSLTVQRSPVSGTSNFRVFHLTTSENYRSFFRGFKIKNGSTNLGGAIYVESPGTALLLNDIVISENSASRGGGIYNEGKLSLARSLVNSNSTVNAPFAGGGGTMSRRAQAGGRARRGWATYKAAQRRRVTTTR